MVKSKPVLPLRINDIGNSIKERSKSFGLLYAEATATFVEDAPQSVFVDIPRANF